MAEQKKNKKKQVVELTPPEKFVQLQTLKRATGCMLVDQDIYDIYVKLTKDFADLDKIGQENPFKGSDECAALSEECARLAEEWKEKLPAERVVESRTVMTTAKEQESKEIEKGSGRWVALGILVFVIACIVCYNVTPTRYYVAQAEAWAGLNDLALASYDKLNGYKESDSLKTALEQQIVTETKKGDQVAFGNCDWRVVAKKDGKVLLARVKALTDVKYHESNQDITWEQCDLRTYLNGEFYDKTFTKAEKEVIAATTLLNDGNKKYNIDGGKKTTDKVFILSEKEAEEYAKGLKEQASDMRLRTPGFAANTTMFLSYKGEVVASGVLTDELAVKVCPMIWVNVE